LGTGQDQFIYEGATVGVGPAGAGADAAPAAVRSGQVAQPRGLLAFFFFEMGLLALVRVFWGIYARVSGERSTSVSWAWRWAYCARRGPRQTCRELRCCSPWILLFRLPRGERSQLRGAMSLVGFSGFTAGRERCDT
jgi:hypothetical protein